MINRLINMEPVLNKELKATPILNANPTIEEYAFAFINGMSDVQKSRFKKMLENGIHCGMSVADNYGIDYDKFINEVKKQMGVV